MKGINLLIGFLIISFSSYANSVNFLRRDIASYDEETLRNSLSEECRTEYENSEYLKCTPALTLTNYKDSCTEFKSEKCQNFFKDPLKYYPICKNSPNFAELYQPMIIKTILQTYDVLCQTDENDELCPFSLNLMKSSNGNGVWKDQCKSKKCTESLLKVYKNISLEQYGAIEDSSYTTGSYSYQELEAKKELVSLLESKECQDLHITDSNINSSSDSITIKISNILLINLSLLLVLSIFY